MVKVKVKQGRIGTVLQYLSCGALLAQCIPSPGALLARSAPSPAFSALYQKAIAVQCAASVGNVVKSKRTISNNTIKAFGLRSRRLSV